MTATPSPALMQMLADVAAGKTGVNEAAQWVSTRNHQVAVIDGATVDLGRRERCGFGEVIFGEGKSTELIQRIIDAQLAAGQTCLVTRIDSTTAAQLRRAFPKAIHNPVARTLRIAATEACDDSNEDLSANAGDQVSPLHVAVVTAGSTDASVAEEAIETLRWMGIPHRRYDDIGVAGPQRLLAAVDRLRTASAVVVAAGMEGALPAAIAGHVAVPVIAVPTSVGYGVNFGGLTPLMGMLTSCAANVAVVNIDAGFKGGYLAGLIVHQSRRVDV